MSEPNRSRYLNAGAPLACSLPSCNKGFENSCYRGKTDRYYCSLECVEVAKDFDFSHVKPFSRAVGL